MTDPETARHEPGRRLSPRQWRAQLRAAQHSAYARSAILSILKPMSREDELAAIASYIAEHGVRRFTLMPGGAWRVVRVRS